LLSDLEGAEKSAPFFFAAPGRCQQSLGASSTAGSPSSIVASLPWRDIEEAAMTSTDRAGRAPRVLRRLAIASALVLLALPTLAGDRTEARFYDRHGRYEGRSVQRGDEARLYDRHGRYEGREVTRGDTMRRYDRQGRFIWTERRR
jgi:hypothetical protein